MSRYKPVGWRNESHRHYLAAKGIKTLKYNSSKRYRVAKVITVTEPTNYDDNVQQTTFKKDGAKLTVVESAPSADGRNSISDLYVPEEKRRKGIAIELMEKAKKKYSSMSSQVSNIPSVKLHYQAGFRPTDNPEASEEEAVEEYEKNKKVGSINMKYESDDNGGI